MSATLHDLIRGRWSPNDFSTRPIEPEKLRTVFEAARWAASCFNEQPWRFIVATKADPTQFEKVLGLLREANQKWPKTAYALGFSSGKKTFSRNGAGPANQLHFMGGFDASRARIEFHIPDDFEVGAAFAIGYIDETTTKHGSERARSWRRSSSRAIGALRRHCRIGRFRGWEPVAPTILSSARFGYKQ